MKTRETVIYDSYYTVEKEEQAREADRGSDYYIIIYPAHFCIFTEKY